MAFHRISQGFLWEGSSRFAISGRDGVGGRKVIFLCHAPKRSFLDATTHLYKRSCRSVRRFVRRSVRPSVCPVLFSNNENWWRPNFSWSKRKSRTIQKWHQNDKNMKVTIENWQNVWWCSRWSSLMYPRGTCSHLNLPWVRMDEL